MSFSSNSASRWHLERLANISMRIAHAAESTDCGGRHLSATTPKEFVACDFFISATASFLLLYVFAAVEIGSRRILHTNVTTHPTADWTLQQFRELLTFDHPYRFVIHDRDAIFLRDLDRAVTGFGVRVLKTPLRAPKANSFCERLIGRSGEIRVKEIRVKDLGRSEEIGRRSGSKTSITELELS